MLNCSNGAGAIDLTVTGGATPYTYLWDDPATSTSEDVAGLCDGSFNITITDANGCIGYNSATLTQPTELINNSTTTVDNICWAENHGSATVNISGSVPPYNYTWSNGNTGSQTADSLFAGTYIVTITDANNCELIINNIEILEPGKLNVAFNNLPTMCIGQSKELVSSVSGGTPTYSYLWNTSETNNRITISPTDTTTYSLTVTDANNCTAIANHKIMQPDVAISVNSEITQTSCKEMNDGAIQLDVEFGTEPYVFDWSTGETTDYLEEIKVGSYLVTITDANNCETKDSIVVTSIKESCLHVYNTLTPNGDGKNDTWIIDGIENFPNCSVKIFNQWGNLVYEHEGYYENWDGTKNGRLLPAATYYYILDLGTGEDVLKGDITIISAENRAPQKPKVKDKIMRKGIDSNNNSKNL